MGLQKHLSLIWSRLFMRAHCTADVKRKSVPKFREPPRSFVHSQDVCTSLSYCTIGFLGILKCFGRAEGKENKESNILGRANSTHQGPGTRKKYDTLKNKNQ